MQRLLLLLPVLFLSAGCYEDRIGCLEVAASNFDILADEACPDCCEFPQLSVDLERGFGPEDLVLADTFLDAFGNRVRLIDLRAYWSDLALTATDDEVFAAGATPVELEVAVGTDTVLADFAETVILPQTTGSTVTTVGRVRTGEAALNGLNFMLGFAEDFPAVVPESAPTTRPLRTQARLLNFNDGAGYVTLSLEYELVDTGEARRVDVYADRMVNLPFPGTLDPIPGADLTLEIRLDYASLLQNLDLTADNETLAAALPDRYVAALLVTGAR